MKEARSRARVTTTGPWWWLVRLTHRSLDQRDYVILCWIRITVMPVQESIWRQLFSGLGKGLVLAAGLGLLAEVVYLLASLAWLASTLRP